MVFRRSHVLRRRFPKRRTFRRKARFAPRRYRRTVHSQVSKFRRGAWPVEFTISLAAGVPLWHGGSASFSLNLSAGYNELTTLYDQYKIAAVKVRFIPRFYNWVLSSTLAEAPRCYYCIDYDDQATPASEDEMLQRSNCKVFKAWRGFSVYFKPSADMTLWNTSTTSAYGRGYQPWIDCDNAAVPHYGLKWGMYHPGDSSGSATPYWDLHVTYYILCKFNR